MSLSSPAQSALVGRDHELAILRERLITALPGSGGLVLISGEAGIGKAALTKVWNGLRPIIETVNDQLTQQFAIGRHQARTFPGLAARLETKRTAHTLCIALNWQLGKAERLQIKALAFPN